MSHASGAQKAPALVLRVSVPAGDGYRAVLKELVAKIAAYVGDPEPEGRTAVLVAERAAAIVAPAGAAGSNQDITFEFRQTNGDLLIEARCAGRSSQGRIRLPE